MPVEEQYDPFQLESGLLGNVDLEITDAVFTNRLEAFDPTKLELHLTVLTDSGEQVVYLGCGAGWETNDGGKTAEPEDGNQKKNFHGNTKVGEFFGGLVALMGTDAKVDKAIRAHVAERGGPRRTDFWKGLQVHIVRQTRKGGGDISDFEVLVIDGFNGIAGGGTAAKATKATKKATKAPAKPAVAAGGLTDAIKETLAGIADAAADHDSFMEAAFEQVPEASTDDAVKAAVSDNTEGSLWHEAVLRFEASQA